MRTILVNIRTELELDRTKLLAIGILFVFFGLTAVLAQMFMPEILALSGLEIVNIPDPSIHQVLADFWGDVAILSMIIILFTMSTFSSELDVSKSGYFYLARPISRRTYYLTRFWIRVGGIIFLFFTSSMLIYGYASLFFDPIDLGTIMLASLLLSLNIGAIAAVVIALSSSFSSSISGAAGLIVVFLQLVLALVEPLKWVSPFALASIWEGVITSSAGSWEVVSHLGVLVAWIILPCLAGLINYSRRDLI